MDVALLKEFCQKIIAQENKYSIQSALDLLRSSMEFLTNSPHDQTQQQNVSNALRSLRESTHEFENEFSAQEHEKIKEIKGSQYFSLKFVNDIFEKISENVMSPAVVRDYINQVTKNRQQYVDDLNILVLNLHQIGVERDYIDKEEAEIGFQIPRNLFKNNLDGLVFELKNISNSIRFLSEVATGSAQEMKVGKISTTDPVIFISQYLPTAVLIAKVVEWILEQWKKVEDIRNVRAQAVKLEQFLPEDIKMFDNKIENVIESAIKEKVESLLLEAPVDPGRKNELRKPLHDVLESLFARIERGMTVELRLHSSTQEADSSENFKDSNETANPNHLESSLETLKRIQLQLKFPSPSRDPILKLFDENKDRHEPN